MQFAYHILQYKDNDVLESASWRTVWAGAELF